MADVDKILEAERNIKNIAQELGRMRDAANLLTSSQAQVEQVLKTAKSVMSATGKFVEECGNIITVLSSIDLNKRFKDFEKMHEDIDTYITELKDILLSEFQTTASKTEKSFEESYKRLDELIERVTSSHSEVKNIVTALREDIVSLSGSNLTELKQDVDNCKGTLSDLIKSQATEFIKILSIMTQKVESHENLLFSMRKMHVVSLIISAVILVGIIILTIK